MIPMTLDYIISRTGFDFAEEIQQCTVLIRFGFDLWLLVRGGAWIRVRFDANFHSDFDELLKEFLIRGVRYPKDRLDEQYYLADDTASSLPVTARIIGPHPIEEIVVNLIAQE